MWLAHKGKPRAARVRRRPRFVSCRNNATLFLRARYCAPRRFNSHATGRAKIQARRPANLPRIRTLDPVIMESEMKRLIYAVVAISALGLGAGNLAIAADNEEQGTSVQAPSDEGAPQGSTVKDDEQQQGSDSQSDEKK